VSDGCGAWHELKRLKGMD